MYAEFVAKICDKAIILNSSKPKFWVWLKQDKFKILLEFLGRIYKAKILATNSTCRVVISNFSPLLSNLSKNQRPTYLYSNHKPTPREKGEKKNQRPIDDVRQGGSTNSDLEHQGRSGIAWFLKN